MGILGGALKPSLDEHRLVALENQHPGIASVEGTIALVRKVRDLGLTFDYLDPEVVPGEVQTNATRLYYDLNVQLDHLAQLNFADESFSSNRASAIRAIETCAREIAQKISMYCLPVPLDARMREIGANEIATRAVAMFHEAEELLSKVKMASAEVAADGLAGFYNRQAKRHHLRSLGYLAVGVLIAITIVSFSVTTIGSLEIDSSLSASEQWITFVRSVVVRLFPVVIGTYILTIIARSYRANEHLRVINEQKGNALRTYSLFAESTQTPESRDLITLELVRVVFATTDTGMLTEVPDQQVVDAGAGLLGLALSKK